MTDKPNEMLPCPWCGSAAAIVPNVKLEDEVCVDCGNADCSFKSGDYHTISQWNTRPVSKMREALEGLINAFEEHCHLPQESCPFPALVNAIEALKGNE